jgi:excisionase family DNA binding protein
MQTTIQPPQSSAPAAIPVLTLEELADYLRLPIASVQRHAMLGQLPGQAIGGEWRFLRSAIDQWLALSLPVRQSRNQEILALLQSWDTPDQEEHQTATWNNLKVSLRHSNT